MSRLDTLLALLKLAEDEAAAIQGAERRRLVIEDAGTSEAVSLQPGTYTVAEAQQLAEDLWAAADEVRFSSGRRRRSADSSEEVTQKLPKLEPGYVTGSSVKTVIEFVEAIKEGRNVRLESTPEGGLRLIDQGGAQ